MIFIDKEGNDVSSKVYIIIEKINGICYGMVPSYNDGVLVSENAIEVMVNHKLDIDDIMKDCDNEVIFLDTQQRKIDCVLMMLDTTEGKIACVDGKFIEFVEGDDDAELVLDLAGIEINAEYKDLLIDRLNEFLLNKIEEEYYE